MTLIEYFDNTYMNSSVWSKEEMIVFQQPIRTNHDIEGWHAKLNRKAQKRKLQFYNLLHLLREEGELVDITAKVLSQGAHLKRQRKGFRALQQSIFTIWEDYLAARILQDDLPPRLAQVMGK